MTKPTRRAWRAGVAALVAALAAAAQAQESKPPAAGPEIEAHRLDKPPRQLRPIEAHYPDQAVAAGIEAAVILLLDIDVAGKVQEATIEERSAHPGLGFEEAALAAVRQLEFEPAEMDGRAIAVRIQYCVRFKPPALAAPAPSDEPQTAPAEAQPEPPPPPPRPPVVNLSGRLQERGTRLPLAGVLVTVFRDQDGQPVGFEATSDGTGGFEFFDLAPGQWNVVVETTGYHVFKTTEEVKPKEATHVVYYVERSSYNPFDVMVTAERPRKEVSRTVLPVQEIEKVPGTGGDPLAVVQNLPGVARSPFLSGQIIVRGAAPEDTRVFVEGSEVPLINHFAGLRSVLPMGILESLEFVPGNFSPAYGRATGGIVDVRLKRLAPPRIGGYVDISLLDAGLYLEAPLGDKGGMALGVRRSYVDAVLSAVVPDDASIGLTVAPRYYDYQLVANYRPAPAHDLRAAFFGSDDRLELLFRNPADFDPQLTGNTLSSSERFYTAQLSYRYVPHQRFENLLRLSYGWQREYDAFGQLLVDHTVHTGQLREAVRYEVGDRLTLTAGTDLYMFRDGGHFRAPSLPAEGEPSSGLDLSHVTDLRVVEAHFAPAGYLEAEIRPVRRWLLLPGLRIDRLPLGHETILQPRLTSRLEVRPWLTLKAGVGLFAQDPMITEAVAGYGNPDLGAERALHSSAGVEFRPWSHVSLDVTAFDKRLWNLVSKTDALVVRQGVLGPQVYDNQGEGRVHGAEIVLRHELHRRFAGWLAYTVSRSIRRDSGADRERLFDYDQTHILTAVATYLLPGNWQLGGRFRFVSGNPRTPVRSAVFNASTDRYDPVYGPVNSARNQAFHQLDLRIDKRWIFRGWILGAYLDVQNVYNRRNPESVGYNYDFRQSTVTRGLPILPIFGLRAEL